MIKANAPNPSAANGGADDDQKNTIPKRENESVSVILLEVLGSGVCGILSNNFFSTDHKIAGIWFSFAAVASLLAGLATGISKTYSPIKTWFAYLTVLLMAAVIFAFWASTVSDKSKPHFAFKLRTGDSPLRSG